MTSEHKKLWDGRFTEATDHAVEEFNASIAFDKALYQHDITASIAHARMLHKCGILNQADLKAIVSGLDQIRADAEAGQFAWSMELEDVHMNIEARLTERIGEAGKRLHTARSRNDQVATDVRLYLRDKIDTISALIRRAQSVLLDLAEREAQTIMPGFTHLQIAQPVTFGHHMMAWCEMLARDYDRLLDCRKRVNVMPLGAAALAGTTFPIDRAFTAQLLGFEAIAENSLDAVSDRDFAIEFCAAASLIMMHLSRFAEELILWTSMQFQFIELPDRFCTGSSIMPQKKNPDVPELLRGKSGRAFGNLMALLTLMKGQPLAYNKDNQEDKEPLFDSVRTVENSLAIFGAMMTAVTLKRENMEQAALRGFATATDLADYLVRKGLPFRDAHAVVGAVVKYCLERGIDLSGLSPQELRGFSPLIDEDVLHVLTLTGSVEARNHVGGTAPNQVRAAIKRARERWHLA